jgi:hypothetical protein
MRSIKLTEKELDFLRQQYVDELANAEQYIEQIKVILKKLGVSSDTTVEVEKEPKERKKRGRKPKAKVEVKVPKKRGRKPKAASEPVKQADAKGTVSASVTKPAVPAVKKAVKKVAPKKRVPKKKPVQKKVAKKAIVVKKPAVVKAKKVSKPLPKKEPLPVKKEIAVHHAETTVPPAEAPKE